LKDFEEKLTEQGTSFEEIIGIKNQDEIKDLLKEYGIEKPLEVAIITTEFERLRRDDLKGFIFCAKIDLRSIRNHKGDS
jgi:hypothetical protein